MAPYSHLVPCEALAGKAWMGEGRLAFLDHCHDPRFLERLYTNRSV